MEDSERLEKGNVLAKVILEILGAPKEHVEKSLKSYVESLKGGKEFEIVKKDFADAEPQKELFSAFVELDIWFKGPGALLDFCFDSLPSSVEIIKPVSLSMESSELSGVLNDLQARLHQTEMAIKTYKARQELMDKNALEIIRNFVLHLTKEGPRSMKEFTDVIGIPEKNLKAFIDKFVKDSTLVEKEGKYGRAGK
jgi:hypothetical protein